MSKLLPAEEKYGMVSQIRRAALSVHLNVAEGSSRKSEVERRRFYEVSRGSIIEIDAALDIAQALDYFQVEDVELLGKQMVKCVKILTGMLASTHH
jgi:four helix bundle protein